MPSQSRRNFLKSSAGLAAAAGGTAVPATAASSSRVLGANDRIRVGLIGCGGMGRSDLRDFLKTGEVECVALCDVDQAQIDETREEVVEGADQKAEFLTQDFPPRDRPQRHRRGDRRHARSLARHSNDHGL